MRRAVSSSRLGQRHLSTTACRRQAGRPLRELQPRSPIEYESSVETELLSLKRSAPPRNVLLVQKAHAPAATAALVEFVRHLQSRYEPAPAVIVEEEVARALRGQVRQPLYSLGPGLAAKVDLIATFGGDGTILRAASLFAAERTVPPILSFSMGTLGFLSEWKFAEYGDAFRQAYHPGTPYTPRGGSAECKGDQCKVILRSRLNVGIFDRSGRRVSLNRDCEGDSDKGEHDNIGEEKAGENVSESGGAADFFAMNEVIVHRGREPHIATIDVFVGTRFLTSAIADGVIVSTPTGSTAYSLSSGGSIVHPLVPALLLTPICPRSLSFRPLVLPATVPITLRLSEHNRARQVEVSIDGVNRRQPLQKGMEIRVVSEQLKDAGPGARWSGGVPLIVRNAAADTPNDSTGDGHWVGGLNGLLKFNHPFGEEARES